MHRCGVLVVRDSTCGMPFELPDVLGMDVIRKCYQELFSQHGEALFSQVSVSEAKSVVQALQKCHHATSPAAPDTPGKVKVRGKRSDEGVE